MSYVSADVGAGHGPRVHGKSQGQRTRLLSLPASPDNTIVSQLELGAMPAAPPHLLFL